METSLILGRIIERLIIVSGAITFGVLGYKLFLHGTKHAESKLSASSNLVKVVFSGSAPGLFFMFAGLCVLLVALIRGGFEQTIGPQQAAGSQAASELRILNVKSSP